MSVTHGCEHRHQRAIVHANGDRWQVCLDCGRALGLVQEGVRGGKSLASTAKEPHGRVFPSLAVNELSACGGSEA